MDQTSTYLDLHQPFISVPPPPHPLTAPTAASSSSSMAHYATYAHPPPPPPSLLQQAYPSAQAPFGHYSYANAATSPPIVSHPGSAVAATAAQLGAQLLPLPAAAAVSAPAPPAGAAYSPQPVDATGQVAPPGMRQPRVTATLWEDEGSLCFQVEAKGICVARREDNHMINGTKLLNVAGMTRGRRDGILKSEKLRHVVKIGPMHLKGVWIPFERALDFANREKITHLLYPLFVHNIGALLYQQPGHGRTSGLVAAADRRRLEQRAPPTPQPTPALHHHHHHHSVHAGNVVGPPMSGPPPGSAAAAANNIMAVDTHHHGGVGRPGLERAHTFPTPPTSAHSILGMSGSEGGYGWGTAASAPGGGGGGSSLSAQGGQPPLSVDVGLSNARSMPSTPATTPPGNGLQPTQPSSSASSYTNGSAAYDTTRPTYASSATAPPPPPPSLPSVSQTPYGSTGVNRYGPPLQSVPYIKHEMRPPAVRSSGSIAETDRAALDVKPPDPLMAHGSGSDGLNHAPAGEEEEAEHEHESEYGHDPHAAAAAAAVAYNANRASYGYNPGPAMPLPAEHSHLSPEMNGSPNAHPASGRATPRLTAPAPPQWTTGYNSPPRLRTAPSSNLYNVMSQHEQLGKSTNGATTTAATTGAETYSSQLGLTGAMSTAGYPTQSTHPTMNGSGSSSSSSSNKRMREMEDDGGRASRPSSRGTAIDGEMDGLKRRKTLREDSLPMVANGLDLDPNRGGLNRTRSAVVPRRR